MPNTIFAHPLLRVIQAVVRDAGYCYTHLNTPHGHLATLQQRLKVADKMHGFSMTCSGGAVFEGIQRMREEMASAHFLSS